MTGSASPNRHVERAGKAEAEERRMNRIARRAIFCMLLIAAIALNWNLLGH
jgi:hypothetical protein